MQSNDAQKSVDPWPWIVAATAFGVYLVTLCPTIYFGDSGELAVAAFGLGIPHVPGYPALTLAGKGSTLVPLGSIAFRLNLLSALLAAASLFPVYLLVRELTGSRTAAAAAALTLAFGYTFWKQSLLQRAYPLNNLLACWILYFACRWHASLDRRYLLASAFLLGLGLGNHEILLICLVPLLVVSLAHWRKIDAPLLGGAAALFVAGLSVYLYLPLRAVADPLLNWGVPDTLGRLTDVVLQTQYHGKMLSVALGPKLRMVGLIFLSFIEEFGPVPFALGVAGLFALLARHRTFGLGLLLLVLANIAIRVNYIGEYEFTQIYRYMLVSYAVIAIGVGMGTAFVIQMAGNRTGRGLRVLLAAALLIALPAGPLLAHLRANDLSGHWAAYEYPESLLRLTEEQALLFVGGDNDIFPLWYIQRAEKRREDVTSMGRAGFESFWLREQIASETDPDWFDPPSLLEGYGGADRNFYAFFANAVLAGDRRVYALFNDAPEPEQARLWARFREAFDFRPEGLALCFSDRQGRRWTGEPDPRALMKLTLDSLTDPAVPRDFHTRGIAGGIVAMINKTGLWLLSERRIAPAAEAFDLALRIAPGDPVILSNLALCYFAAGLGENAEALLERAVAAGDGVTWSMFYNLGRIRLARGDRAGAREALAEALRLDPGNEEVRALSETLDAKGEGKR